MFNKHQYKSGSQPLERRDENKIRWIVLISLSAVSIPSSLSVLFPRVHNYVRLLWARTKSTVGNYPQYGPRGAHATATALAIALCILFQRSRSGVDCANLNFNPQRALAWEMSPISQSEDELVSQNRME
jgi:hypothetical protein